MQNKISILILTYNRAKDLKAFIENIALQKDLDSCLGEILILNNHSTEDYSEVEKCIAAHPELPINYVFHSENLGVSRGRNYLFQKAQYPYLLVLDDDMEFSEKDAIKKLSLLWEKEHFKNKNIGIITFGVFYHHNKKRQKSALPHKKYNKYKNKEWFFTYFYAGGANIMKKSLINDIGYYPESFFYGMEEYDYSYKMIKKGYSLAYDGTVNVLHKESPRGRISNKEKVAMMWYNKSVVAWKYLPKKYYFSTIFLWSFFYLKETRGDFKGFFKTWKKIKRIPKIIQTEKLDTKALSYLRSVEARLWY